MTPSESRLYVSGSPLGSGVDYNVATSGLVDYEIGKTAKGTFASDGESPYFGVVVRKDGEAIGYCLYRMDGRIYAANFNGGITVDGAVGVIEAVDAGKSEAEVGVVVRPCRITAVSGDSTVTVAQPAPVESADIVTLNAGEESVLLCSSSLGLLFDGREASEYITASDVSVATPSGQLTGGTLDIVLYRNGRCVGFILLDIEYVQSMADDNDQFYGFFKASVCSWVTLSYDEDYGKDGLPRELIETVVRAYREN